MELIEIIRTTLIIFAVASTIFLLITYGVYKLKNRTTVKPHLKDEKFVSPVVLINKINNNPDAEIPKPAEVKSISSRFQILNKNPLNKVRTETFTTSIPVHQLRYKPVISYYSFNKKDRMHKIHSAHLVDES